jgi:hypothetical protein
MNVMIERMITETQKMETILVMKLRVTSIKITNEKMIDAMIPWKAPVTKAFSAGMPVQAPLDWNMLFISSGAFSF